MQYFTHPPPPSPSSTIDSDADFDNAESSDTESGSEGERLRQRILYHKNQGRSKSRRSDWSNKLVNREFEFWSAYCKKLGSNPASAIQHCGVDMYKAYLEWRVESSQGRVKKESTIKMYWRRILCKYIDVAGHSLNDGSELDIQNWIPAYLTPTYKLDTSEKEKHAMFVQDLYVILHAHWALDPKPQHGRSRVEMSLILLLSGATATRPGALIESGSAKGSNKALSYQHISILKIRDVEDSTRSTVIAKVDLMHIKNSGGKGRRKRFIFRLESTPAFCIVSHIVALAISDKAFQEDMTLKQIFQLEIPPHKDCLRLKFKSGKEQQPIFRDTRTRTSGISDTKALSYHKCREHFVWLGLVAGFQQPLELYQLRRASGRKLNSALTPEERNQTMGHHGNTYEQFYLPDLIERDFQSIYFGTQSQDKLIESAARMGLSRDLRAPIALSKQQKEEIRCNSSIAKFRRKRDRVKSRIIAQYNNLNAAKETELYERYDRYRRKVISLTNILQKKCLKETIQEFHNQIDAYDIKRQHGSGYHDLPSRTVIRHEFQERTTITDMLSHSLIDLKDVDALSLRTKFIDNLTRYCAKQESRRLETFDVLKKKKRVTTGHHDSPMIELLRTNDDSNSEDSQEQFPHTSDAKATDDAHFPLTFTGSVCLICIGNEELSTSKRCRPFANRYTLQNHIDSHIRLGVFKVSFECKHPHCQTWIEGVNHFMNHAARAHNVQHQIKRSS